MNFLEKAAKAYYQGTPIISDAEYDALADKDVLGYSDNFKFSHLRKMLSLQKVYAGDSDPLLGVDGTICVTPKLDGAAVSLRYSEGEFVLGLTRGDGIKGVDVTDKLATLVPSIIDIMGEVQITGEVVCLKSVPNARNVAAGSLNLKSLDEFETRPLKFIAYDIYPKAHNLWSEDMDEVAINDFSVVLESDWQQYPHDGKVFRVDQNHIFEEMGYTAHHPRGAYAFKEKQVGVVTKLRDVMWQVGKSGVVSPVAILDPVLIGEAKVTRATLHNMRYIEELGLELGCSVEVIRSGEIIPRIVRRI